MNKIFLSHSSKDKNFIEPIAKYFGNDRCIFDEVTFESGMPTLLEIFKHIENTGIFVYFISDAALNSPWVKQEINKAEEILNNNQFKLSQIIPIIIDSNITHDDDRIPLFLRNGFGAYNLRHIDNEKIACKKIESQLTLLTMRQDDVFAQKIDLFVGRDLEKKKFKDCFEERTIEGKIKHIKCLIVSGIHGIGRKSFVQGVLKDSGLMEKHYFPMVITLERGETIDDLIVKISDLGFGGYRLSDIVFIKKLDDKIEVLVDLFNKAQKYLEHIIIEDNACLLDESGVLKFWMEKALQKINNQITLSIVSHISLDSFKYRKNEFIFNISLEELSPSDGIALLRKHSKLQGIPFNENQIDQVASVLTGFPPQIVFCVDLAKERGIQYVVTNQHEIFNMPNQSSGKIIDMVVEPENRNEYLGLLALLAKFGSTPMGIIQKIIKNNKYYSLVISRLKRFNICSYIGYTGEYLKLSSTIRDYVQRMKYEMTPQLKNLIQNEVEIFQKNINSEEYTDYLDFSELTLYLKENIKKGNTIPDKFLYSTLYIQAILDLYNDKDFKGVILLTQSLKSKDDFHYMDEEIKKTIQFYYCSSLARRKSTDFDAEIAYFEDSSDYERYNFLKGFQARFNGNYVWAERYFKNVLAKNFNHHTARREMVLVYSNLQEYETALELARINYNRFPENIFHIQAFFDCIIRQPIINDNDSKLISTMLNMAKTIHRNRKSEIYFQLEAKYYAFLDKNKDAALKFIEDGLSEFPKSFYLARDGFDILKFFNDIGGMEKYYKILQDIANLLQTDYRIPLFYRECYLNAYKKKPLTVLKMQIQSNKDIPEDSRLKLVSNIEKLYKE